MTDLFSKVLNMSLTASVVILFVMAARLVLRKTPKIYSYALWAVVLFRLLCPVSLPSAVSVLELAQPQVSQSDTVSTVSFVSYRASGRVSQKSGTGAAVPQEQQADPAPSLMEAASWIWLVGMAVMALFSAVQYLRLRRKLVEAVQWRGEVYLTDSVASPFVMGIFRPRIYMPSCIPMKERCYIIAHERHHIRRGDPVIKLLAYGALCIHWFNPLAWAAFILAGKDMEMSCDEAVIRKLGEHIRADYSQSLLNLATHRSIIAGTPLAFGEGDTKGRIVNMANWKKPRVWVSILCAVVCIAVLAACAVNPEKETEESIAPETAEKKALSSVIDGSNITYGGLTLTIPEAYTCRKGEDGSLILTRDGVDVGGITHWNTPDLQLVQPSKSLEGANMEQWVSALGIPEAQEAWQQNAVRQAEETPEEPIAFMIEGSGDYLTAWYGNELYPEKLNREHDLFISGNVVYDIWHDENVITDEEAGQYLKTVLIDGEPTAVTELESGETENANAVEGSPVVTDIDITEEKAKQMCRDVLELVQSGSCEIAREWQNAGTVALNDSSTSTFWQNGENWLSIVEIPEDGGPSIHGSLYVDDVYYDNEGYVWDENGDPNWAEKAAVEVGKPWLAVFQWDPAKVTYMDTLQEEDGFSVMLRIDEPYPYGTDNAENYFVSFTFDTEGNFVEVYKQVNVFQDNGYREYESIVTLDPETVAAEIDRQYQRAIG